MPALSFRLPLGGLFLIMMTSGCQTPPADMLPIPTGSFIMGSDKQDRDNLAQQFSFVKPLYQDEHPQRTVTLPRFFIDRTEVTNRRFLDFVQVTHHRAPPHWRDGKPPPTKEDHPVTMVNWFDAEDFCRWAGRRLPTETEWEKAARGPDGREYPWGSDYDPAAANTGDAGLDGTAAVGRFPKGRSPYGLDDMAGNVMEWVVDWYDLYPGATTPNPLFGERFKVVRGGSYGGKGGHYALQLFYRAAFRQFADPRERYPDIGFRCAKDG